jgi:hypothetical protein
MSRFLDLNEHTPKIADGVFDFSARELLFPATVAASRLRLWSPGDPIPDTGTRILIGTATWSGYDMRLLDVIDEALGHMNGRAPVVEVFNAGSLTRQEAFDDYIPSIGEVLQMPVVGVWQDGRLVEQASGYAARELVARMFGSTSDEIVEFIRRSRIRIPG